MLDCWCTYTTTTLIFTLLRLLLQFCSIDRSEIIFTATFDTKHSQFSARWYFLQKYTKRSRISSFVVDRSTIASASQLSPANRRASPPSVLLCEASCCLRYAHPPCDGSHVMTTWLAHLAGLQRHLVNRFPHQETYWAHMTIYEVTALTLVTTFTSYTFIHNNDVQ